MMRDHFCRRSRDLDTFLSSSSESHRSFASSWRIEDENEAAESMPREACDWGVWAPGAKLPLMFRMTDWKFALV